MCILAHSALNCLQIRPTVITYFRFKLVIKIYKCFIQLFHYIGFIQQLQPADETADRINLIGRRFVRLAYN